MSTEEQIKIIKHGTVEIYSVKELATKIDRFRKNHKPLRVKLGVDPTAPDIHLGHTVVLRKLRQFQDLGHQAVLIIGDFTTLFGDPSGQNKTRPQLSPEMVEKNARTYFDQVGKILDINRAEIVRNSTWLKKLTMLNILELASHITVSQLIQRADFSERLQQQRPIGFHELLYPLMQAYDSIMVQADVELGGTDQTFNLLLGRDLQTAKGMPSQIAITMPLLVGLDGTQKMSKSLDNYIGVTEEPFEMYSKTMSLPDRLMADYFHLLTNLSEQTMASLLSTKTHPKEAKKKLAREIVCQFHDESMSQQAADRFERVFTKKEVPHDITEIRLSSGRMWLPKLLSTCGLAKSNKDAIRLVNQGAVLLDGIKLSNAEEEMLLKDGMIFQVGKKKRFCRIRLK